MSNASKQPKWDIYEAAILLEAVFSVESGKETKTVAIEKVSADLRNLAKARGLSIDETFRNINGITFQYQSMEYSALGRKSATNKTGSKVFDEVVSMYKNENDKYNQILSETTSLRKTASSDVSLKAQNLKDEFEVWLRNGGKNQKNVDAVIGNFNKVSDYALEKKLITVPLFEMSDSKEVNRVLGNIQAYKFFRVLKKDLYKFLVSNSKLYSSFLKSRPKLTEKTNSHSFSEAEESISTASDRILFDKYGDMFVGIYNILKRNDKHVYLTVDQICAAYPNAIDEVIEILEKASWSERLGDGFVHGQNKPSGDKRYNFNCGDSFSAFTNVESILADKFKRGFRPSSIMDRNRFVAAFEEKCGEELSADELLDEVQSCCFRFDDRFFLPKALIDQDAMERIIEFLEHHFEKNSILFNNILYSTFESECGSFIYSADMLMAFLQKVLCGSTLYYFDRYCSIEKDAKPDITTEVIDYLIQMDCPRSYDDIYCDLSHLNQSDIYNVLHYNNPEILGNSKNEYFHVKSAHISDEDRDGIRSIATMLLNSSKYITCNEIMENLDSSSSELMERLTAKFSTLGIRRILTYYLRSDFNVGTGIVTEKSIKFTVEDVFADFAKTHASFTVDDVQRLSEYTGTVPYWEPIYTNAVRINSNEFVQSIDLDFDIEGIDAAIGFYCTDYLPLSEISDYSRFPSCGTTWNIFLLQQYVFRFSNQFKLLSLGFSKGNASGVIARKQSGYPDFESVVIDALEKTNIVSPNDAMNFLCEKGFISERRYKKHADLLKIAIMRRNKD